ncbi:MAG: hypothetical protein HY889_03845 [Deltaproteobacteria bacterium]|nr:hypothetical protein [Deltaproteobacteria bacterium]
MGRKLFAIVLLFGMLSMSASVYCQSLCVGGHAAHSSHAAQAQQASTRHQHQAAHCDLSHSNEKAKTDCPHPDHASSIKCDCSGELTVVYGYHLLGSVPPVHAPILTQVTTVKPSDLVYHSPDIPPSEGPPKITA